MIRQRLGYQLMSGRIYLRKHSGQLCCISERRFGVKYEDVAENVLMYMATVSQKKFYLNRLLIWWRVMVLE